MIALLSLLFVGSFAAPYEQTVFGVRNLNNAILEVTAPLLESSYGQPQLVEVASPFDVQSEIPITKFHHIINPEAGEYSLDFQTANGISTKESGFLKEILKPYVESSYGYGGETRIQEVAGIFQAKSGETSWCSPEGIRITLTYVADETGYHPEITKGSCDIYAYDIPVESRAIVSNY